LSPDLPAAPPWIEDLPRDSRGYPVPAEAGWQDGHPLLKVVATDRKVALGMRRACAVCGYQIPKGATVYRAWAQGDAAHMRMYEREQSHDMGGPLHYSCIIYSTMACPYLREKRSRLGKDSKVNPGARRGSLAAVMGFRDFGILVYAQPHQFLHDDAPPPQFAYLGLVDDIPYRDGEEIANRYAEAVESDSQIIETSRPRLYWTDREDDLKALATTLRSDFRTLEKAEPAHSQVIVGVGRYVAFPM